MNINKNHEHRLRPGTSGQEHGQWHDPRHVRGHIHGLGQGHWQRWRSLFVSDRNRFRKTGWDWWSWSLSLRLVYPVLHKPPGATITSRSAVRIRINFWRMVGLYRLSQCTWVLKVSVLETGHTRYCSISGSDPLRQSYRLCHGYCRKTPTTNQPTNKPTNQPTNHRTETLPRT